MARDEEEPRSASWCSSARRPGAIGVVMVLERAASRHFPSFGVRGDAARSLVNFIAEGRGASFPHSRRHPGLHQQRASLPQGVGSPYFPWERENGCFIGGADHGLSNLFDEVLGIIRELSREEHFRLPEFEIMLRRDHAPKEIEMPLRQNSRMWSPFPPVRISEISDDLGPERRVGQDRVKHHLIRIPCILEEVHHMDLPLRGVQDEGAGIPSQCPPRGSSKWTTPLKGVCVVAVTRDEPTGHEDSSKPESRERTGSAYVEKGQPFQWLIGFGGGHGHHIHEFMLSVRCEEAVDEGSGSQRIIGAAE